jgi:hypothetical protein
MRSKQLGQLLIESGDATPEKVAQALKTQDAHGGLLGSILQQLGACTPEAISHALAKQVQVTDVVCEELSVLPEVTDHVQKDFCLREKLCPFEMLGNLLCVVMANPLHRNAVLDIESKSHLKVKAFKAAWPKINDLIERAYSPQPAPLALEDISLDLQDEPSAHAAPAARPAPNLTPKSIPPTRTAHVAPTAHIDEPLILEDDIIIPPSQPEGQPAGPTGILEIPMDATIPVPSQAAIPMPKFGHSPVNPKIKGLESLDSGDAELVDVAKRKSESGRTAMVKRPDTKKAQVNVDLDSFDHSGEGEIIDTSVPPETEAIYEIEHGGLEPGAPREAGEVLVVLKLVPDSCFYTGTAPKNAPRADDLLDVIEALPVAEVVARSITEYEMQESGAFVAGAGDSSKMVAPAGLGMVGKSRVELQRAPATPMAAVRLGEGEFVKLTLMQVEDEAGEWEWNYASPGPVPVETFDE